jgi:chaperonin GroEL
MITTEHEVKEKLLQGINMVADAVSPTLGPQAKTAILQGNPPVIINDGVTITKYVMHDDPYVQMGIQMVQNLASQAQDKSGDGTTTACILARSLCNSIFEHYASIENMRDFQNEFERMQSYVVNQIENQSIDIGENDVYDVAYISSNNDTEIAGMITDAIKKVGKDGVITVQEGKTYKNRLVVREGVRLDEGYLSHLMANQENGTCEFENPMLFLSNLPFNNFQELLPMLEIAAVQKRPLLILCKGMEGSALNNLIMNILQKTVQVAVIMAPNFGDAQLDELGDLQALVGGKIYNNESRDDPTLVSIGDFGSCDRVIVTKEYSTIIGGEGDVKSRIATLRALADDMQGYDKNRIKSRIARLKGGVATIEIGASSAIEMRESKERLDDALNATKAALAEGIVKGGGMTYGDIANFIANESKDTPIEIMLIRALLEPITALLANSNVSKESMEVWRLGGFNALTGEFGELTDVYDPTRVARESFLAAMSIAKLFLTTSVAITVEE